MSTFTKSYVPKWLTQDGVKPKSGHPIDKSLSCPRIKVSRSETLIWDVVKTGLLSPDFAQQTHRKNAEATDLFSISLGADGLSSTALLNQNAKAKKRESWLRCKICTSEAAEVVHTWRCY